MALMKAAVFVEKGFAEHNPKMPSALPRSSPRPTKRLQGELLAFIEHALAA
ncbi:hypothetical protein [Pseudomonas sp. NFX15]|uniref:hypothetical protein n=1 Tax=Pseudomonas sp. NFX15 TaxID=2816958 RepID=UPI003B8B2DE6